MNVLDGVKIFHIRNRHGKCPREACSRGGLTLAVKYLDYNEPTIYVGMGVCGHKHTFNKKLGAKVATGRLDRLLNGPYSGLKFSDKYPICRFGNDSEIDMILNVAHILIKNSKLAGKQLRTALKSIQSTKDHYSFMEEVKNDKTYRKLGQE